MLNIQERKVIFIKRGKYFDILNRNEKSETPSPPSPPNLIFNETRY